MFGTTPQKCFIPAEDIIAVYSPEMATRFITAFQGQERTVDEFRQEPAKRGGGDENRVVSVDFRKRNK